MAITGGSIEITGFGSGDDCTKFVHVFTGEGGISGTRDFVKTGDVIGVVSMTESELEEFSSLDVSSITIETFP